MMGTPNPKLRRNWPPPSTLALAFAALGGSGCAATQDHARLEQAIQALTQSIERLNARIDRLEGPARVAARKAPAPPKKASAPKAKAKEKKRGAEAARSPATATPVAKTPSARERSEPAPPRTAEPSEPVASGSFVPDAELFVCPRIKVSNRPHINKDRKIIYYRPFLRVGDKVMVAVAPVNGACLTSGFGNRRGRKHKGVDYQGKPAPMIHAAAAGTIVEAEYRDDYGNMVVIDHGEGVYTRYAHLRGFQPGIKAGKKIPFGRPLGLMGSTAKWALPLHLHYEILVGDYNTPKKSFGLRPKDPFWMLFETRPPSRSS